MMVQEERKEFKKSKIVYLVLVFSGLWFSPKDEGRNWKVRAGRC